MHITHLEIVIRILAALLCGILLGAEREYRGREAGLKSHAGLAVACCLAILVSAFGFADAVTSGLIALDPSRIAAGVEGGIGFACAAVIWRSRSKVIGLTTAINIWATANIGMACGAGMFYAAALITGVMLFIHVILGAAERRLFPRHEACTLVVTTNQNCKHVTERVGQIVCSSRASILAVHTDQHEPGQPATIELELGKGNTDVYLKLLDNIQQLDGVTSVNCTGLSNAD